MTNTERTEMFSKDYLTNDDISALLGVDKATASTIITAIKRKSNRLDIRGKVMVQDYLDAFNLPSDRYVFNGTTSATGEK